MSDPNAPRPGRPRRIPFMDALGRLCVEGRQVAAYLWQVPDDDDARRRIVALLDRIAAEAKRQGRREMPRICEQLKAAANAEPSPQRADVLVSGFDRLTKLWQAAKSGL